MNLFKLLAIAESKLYKFRISDWPVVHKKSSKECSHIFYWNESNFGGLRKMRQILGVCRIPGKVRTSK